MTVATEEVEIKAIGKGKHSRLTFRDSAIMKRPAMRLLRVNLHREGGL
jgi:hypothetical protein